VTARAHISPEHHKAFVFLELFVFSRTEPRMRFAYPGYGFGSVCVAAPASCFLVVLGEDFIDGIGIQQALGPQIELFAAGGGEH
jgi:hypothetical protein